MKDGAIFDLDGTLLDSMWVWDRVDEEFLGARGFAVPTDYAKAISAMGFVETAEYTINRFSLKESVESVIQEWNKMAERTYHDEVATKPFAGELLREMKDRGMKLGVATSSYGTLFYPCLKRNGIHQFFDAFTETSEVPRGKGFPDVYIKAAEKLGCQPAQCVVFEDIPEGIAAARAGGFFTVAVYDDRSKEEWEEICRRADFSIRSFGEFLERPELLEKILES